MSDPLLSGTLLRLHETLYENPCPEQQEKATLEFLTLVTASHLEDSELHRVARAQAPHHAMRAVRDYIHARSAEPLTLRMLAQVAGLSCFYTVRLFRATFGISPLAYLAVIRVHHARALMRKGVSIAQAGLDSGFHDQSHLTRFFKRVSGMTPGVYARATRPR